MFDSLTVASLADELSHRLLGGHIQKVLQLDADSIGFEIYAEHQRQYLVASANSRNPRLYLTSTRLSADPSSVSPLLLLLRKYARGGGDRLDTAAATRAGRSNEYSQAIFHGQEARTRR